MTELDNTQPPPTPTDALLNRVILIVGCVVVLSLVGVLVLSYFDKPSPDVLEATLTGGLGGLLGLLAGKRSG